MNAEKLLVRQADKSELDSLARLWFDGWRDAHLGLIPQELARHRTLGRFRARLDEAFDLLRVAGPLGAPAGFVLVRDNEANQLFVAASARGKGVAAALMDDVEARLAASGAAFVWATCVNGNNRAARFYEKRGFKRAGEATEMLPTPQGDFPLKLWRYEKRFIAS